MTPVARHGPCATRDLLECFVVNYELDLSAAYRELYTKSVSCKGERMINAEDGRPGDGWTFLTNHAHVLVCVALQPDVRIRTIAQCVGITERATQRIISELVEAGYLTKLRLGRRNFYEIQPHMPLRHPLERDHVIGEILSVLVDRATGPTSPGSGFGEGADEHGPSNDRDARTR